MLQIPVELGERRYTVSVGHGLARALPEALAALRGRRTVVVASRRVLALHGRALERPLRALGAVATLALPDGERYKNAATIGTIHDALVEARLGRDGLVLALGGGVVGDMAGFAAATYMRGVDWVGVPTTLLAMVDSSVGGKTGINHPRGKNLIGAFHQPRAVVIDPSFLETLPVRELRAGAHEVLKCAVLADAALFDALERAPAGVRGWDADTFERSIATAVRVKAEVVAGDEKEGGWRRVLNLGHTIGHALEAVTRYRRFVHGEAVGWGLVGAAAIARDRGLMLPATFERVAAGVDRLGPRPRVSDLDARAVLEAVSHDKKARKGRVPFVLPTAIGRVEIHDDVTAAEIRKALRAMAVREGPL
jgi:3-dehydroquinate synthase